MNTVKCNRGVRGVLKSILLTITLKCLRSVLFSRHELSTSAKQFLKVHETRDQKN